MRDDPRRARHRITGRSIGRWERLDDRWRLTVPDYPHLWAEVRDDGVWSAGGWGGSVESRPGVPLAVGVQRATRHLREAVEYRGGRLVVAGEVPRG